ncbi:carboxypeptidase-like regulatory domain-containing protein [Cellulophaga baltica]|uniref:carboxypeptidase-like regulatory domain-containing protein n=1 Tax=Cellulophaga baltica TaxID=76594 RepID=UPI0015F3AA7F|nr:carboxypeptidase-like regulatory domain-containing protein [Cellulophaga baltica]MBA6313639.1 carboxypeptidase-like regulatory domain-containing protein [Cellulophaga baltica]
MNKVLSALLFLVTITTFSQNSGKIIGNVSDAEIENEALLFASVKIKDTPNVAQTNFHGNYEFENIASGEYTLVFTFLGYETKEVAVSVKNNEISRVDGALKSKTIAIDLLSDDEIAATEKSKNTVSRRNSSLK